MNSPSNPMSGPSSVSYNPYNGAQAVHHQQPPPSSRDATATSRFFPPENGSRILVPNSSPLAPDHNYQQFPQHNQGSPPRYGGSPYWQQQQHQPQFPSQFHQQQYQPQYAYQPAPTGYFRDDPLNAPSGFTSRQSNGRPISEVDGVEYGQPRKRPNLGPPPPSSPDDPLNIIDIPGSPEYQRIQRRRLISTTSSDESYAEGSSKRLRRGNSPEAAASAEDPRFTRFKMTMPTFPLTSIQAAWQQSGGDVKRATGLLQDPNWRPISVPTERVETGRVKEVDEEHKASRAAAREKAKNSSIYANRVGFGARAQQVATPQKPPPAKPPSIVPETPASPPMPTTRRRRIKRVVESESEGDYEESEPERSPPPVKAFNNHRLRALEFFNAAGLEALQELTGTSFLVFVGSALHFR